MKRRTILKGAAVGLIGTATATTGAAATDQDCDSVVSRSGDGDFTSIQSAVYDAQPGDTICVNPGVYEEEVWVGKDDLTFIGNPGKSDEIGPGKDRPIVDGGALEKESGTGFIGNATGTTIKGFEIRNYKQPRFGTGIKPGPADITISDNYLHGFSANGIGRAGLGQESPHGYTVERNRIEKTGINGIRLDNVSDTVVANNIVNGSAEVEGGKGEDGTKTGIFLHSNIGNPRTAGDENVSVDNSNIRIEGNRITGDFTRSGIWVFSINRNNPENPPKTSAVLRDVLVRRNTVTDNSNEWSSGIGVTANAEAGEETRVEDIEVRENEIRNVWNGAVVNSSPEGTVNNVRFVQNEFRNNAGGVTIFQKANGSEVVVHQNNIVGNENWGLRNTTNGTVSAEQNYWGSPSGPKRSTPGNGKKRVGKGDEVIGPVDVKPWEPKEI